MKIIFPGFAPYRWMPIVVIEHPRAGRLALYLLIRLLVPLYGLPRSTVRQFDDVGRRSVAYARSQRTR
jgi:hypothetical protein